MGIDDWEVLMDWIEKLFRVSPEDSSGVLELVIVGDDPSAWYPKSELPNSL